MCVGVFLMADYTNVSSKLSVANRASQFWRWRPWWWSLGSGFELFAPFFSLADSCLHSSAPFLIRLHYFVRSCAVCSQDSGGMLKSLREAYSASSGHLGSAFPLEVLHWRLSFVAARQAFWWHGQSNWAVPTSEEYAYFASLSPSVLLYVGSRFATWYLGFSQTVCVEVVKSFGVGILSRSNYRSVGRTCHLKQRINWFEKIYLFDFSKEVMVYNMKTSGAWYALHTFAEMEWHH